jgi:DNA-binding response OmpR family regulator
MRILVVEDEQRLATAIRRGLEEQGYAVDLARDGQRALALATARAYDLLILDATIPRLDGPALGRQLRARGPEVPILVLSALDGVDLAADDHMVRPFAFRELLARVRALLERDGRRGDTVLRAADIEVDTAYYEVRRAGRPVRVTSKEFRILEYFLRNPNRVLSRAQIAAHVWDSDDAARSNVVDVYVGYLRRKLADDRDPRLLRTVRGAGYMLRAPR